MEKGAIAVGVFNPVSIFVYVVITPVCQSFADLPEKQLGNLIHTSQLQNS